MTFSSFFLFPVYLLQGIWQWLWFFWRKFDNLFENSNTRIALYIRTHYGWQWYFVYFSLCSLILPYIQEPKNKFSRLGKFIATLIKKYCLIYVSYFSAVEKIMRKACHNGDKMHVSIKFDTNWIRKNVDLLKKAHRSSGIVDSHRLSIVSRKHETLNRCQKVNNRSI